MATNEKKSYCRVCGSGCGIMVELDNERVTGVRADRDHGLTAGYTCPKGRFLPEDHNREDRIEFPMMRIDGETPPFSRSIPKASSNCARR